MLSDHLADAIQLIQATVVIARRAIETCDRQGDVLDDTRYDFEIRGRLEDVAVDLNRALDRIEAARRETLAIERS